VIVRGDRSRRFRSGLAAGQVTPGRGFEAGDESSVAKRPPGALAGADRLQHAVVEPRRQEVSPCAGGDAQRQPPGAAGTTMRAIRAMD
jgi:hypothetical protein